VAIGADPRLPPDKLKARTPPATFGRHPVHPGMQEKNIGKTIQYLACTTASGKGTNMNANDVLKRDSALVFTISLA
jgi:hypothetical protein